MNKYIALLLGGLVLIASARGQLVSDQNINGFTVSTITFGSDIYAVATNNPAGGFGDWTAAVKSEFGSVATVAEFNTLKSDVGSTANGTALYNWLFGLNNSPLSTYLTYNNNQFYNGGYPTFIQTQSAPPGSGWFVIDKILTTTTAQTSLGRWDLGNAPILALVSPSSPSPVPEPSTYALFGIGAIGMLMVLRRKKTA